MNLFVNVNHPVSHSPGFTRLSARRAWTVGALGVCGLVLLSCGPQVPLRQPRDFSTREVKLALWHDRCELQGFFEADPPDNPVIEERAWSEQIMPGVIRSRGYVTVRIAHPTQRRRFRQLLRRYYRRSPSVPHAAHYDVTVPTTRPCNKPRMRRDALARVQAGPRELTLAYHPCLAQYLLDRDLYETRAQLVEQGEIESVVAQKRSAKTGSSNEVRR